MAEKQPEEKAPEGVNEDLWKQNQDLQKKMREQIEQEEADKLAAAQEAVANPTTSTMPSQTVEEAGAANEAAAKRSTKK